MKKSIVLSLTIAAMVAATATAQEFLFAGFRDVEAAFASQQAELDQLRTRLASYQDGTVVEGGVGKGCCESCCGCPSWTAAADLLLLTGKHNDSDAANRFDTEAGYRLTFGRDDGCGSGYRVRYMDWDASEAYDEDNDTLDRLEVESLDIEWYTTCQICRKTSLEMSAGVRYFDYLENFDLGSASDTCDIDGWGPVVGLEATHCFNDCLSLFTLVRESIGCLGGNTFGDDIDNQIGLISEVQVGVEYTQCTCNGTCFVRAALEGQSYADVGESAGYGAGLFGYTLSAGITR